MNLNINFTKRRKILILFFSFFLAVILTAIFLPSDPFRKDEVIFPIVKGEGLKEISVKLENEGLISWGSFFRVYVLVTGSSKKLQAGNYLVSADMNIFTIVNKFSRGDVIKEKITIIEGWNLKDIGFYLEQNGISPAENFWELCGFPAVDYSSAKDLPKPEDFSQEYAFLEDKPKTVGLEGYLFPDTYELSRDSSIKDVVRKILDNFDKKLTSELRSEIKNQKKTIFEIVTMASLIEKEVKTYEDKQIVSGILWKRLGIGMPLQVDASVSYVIDKNGTGVSIEDTKADSPYNTYKYRGLPLGPISNPGSESIKAAIYSKSSPYWYYLSTLEGKTIFSRTLEEHNIAKAKYLK